MRRFLFLMILAGVTIFSFHSAPAHAQVAGPCSALNGATFTTAANAPFITGTYQFNPGDTIVYSLTYSFPSFTATSVSVQTSLGAVFSPVAQATFATNPIPPAATVSYTFTSTQTTQLRFDWNFAGSGSFVPHNINTVVNCGQQGATIPTLSEWGLLLLTLALAAVGLIRLRRS